MDERLENSTVINLFTFVEFQKQTLKDLYLDRKKGKGSYYSIMGGKSNNNGSAISARNPGVEHVFWTSELKDCLSKF